ncbi:MAG: hypothetical protein RL488_18 [Actinomycetota bacterium]|jgi:hypothetical membrane protein
MQKIEKVAVVAAILGPIQSVLGWTSSGALTPGYDIVSQTISELASVDAPTHILQSSFFILGGTLTILAAIFARTLAMPGRIALFVSGLCTYGLTIFPTPLHGKSPMHLLFAITSFVLSAGWPLAAMRFRKDAPRIIRPTAAILQTAFQATIAIIFLVVWSDPAATTIGVWERIVTTGQALQVSVVVLVIYWQQRKSAATGKS